MIIPTRNGAATIAAQLQALGRQTYQGRWELIVVDNGSTDGTAALVDAFLGRLPELRLHPATGQAGTSYARNEGCRVSRGELLLFCDQDDIVGPEWVAEMVRGLAEFPAVGGHVERHLLNDDVSLATRPEKPPGSLQGGFDFLPYALGANCGVRRAVYEELGGFDPHYRYGSDEVSFFWRAQLAGHRLGALPDAVVHYRLRRDLRGMARQYYSYGTSHPRLYRDFATAGLPRSVRSAAREWRWLLHHLPDLFRSRKARAVWVTRCAMRCGRLVGSLRNRVLFP
ncbi:glycosyltransferase involved in cell wall biosynthesis [Plantactinospora soyae]|uniref:Glycosyltransferase involved in cell wall biosynthesis n=1 Tax=Plantactinospora soyae TaxID=1544732 RepID=A0A927QWB2_9ACTN|nr:glycosyltransferase involved in cell wall biosynthesis [Plantactinospora soyae]